MTKSQKTKTSNAFMPIGNENSKAWSPGDVNRVQDFIKSANSKRTVEQRRKTELLAISYKIEEYLEQSFEQHFQRYTIEVFLKQYLTVLDIPLKTFATSIEWKDSNLKKYLSGARKFNIDLAMRFGSFFHTPPDLWLKIDIKNQLAELNQEKEKVSSYQKKFDYIKVLEAV